MESSVGRVKIAYEEAALSAEERRNIRHALKSSRAKSREQKLREDLVGASPTTGKYVRGAAIGALGGMGAGTLGGLIQGDVKVRPWKVKNPIEKRRALLHPRRLLAGATVGGIYGAMVPAAQRLADLEAAKRGMY